jgi:hypothetical protein
MSDDTMDLDDAIDHAVEVADKCAEDGNEECELEHRQLIRWLTELRDLRPHARQLARDLDTTREKLRDLHRDIGISLTEAVHVDVHISHMSRRWRHAHRISGDLWTAPLRGFHGQDQRVVILSETIQKIAYEAAIGFLSEGE